MKIRGQHLVCILMLLFFAAASQAYDVVLKNGKVVKGTVVSEDASLVVLQDADGLRINIKKTNIDVEKTQATNPPAKTVVSSQNEKSEQAAPVKAQEKPAPRKPAKKLSEEDLEKLREKYDLGEGTFNENAYEEPTEGAETTPADPELVNDDFSLESEKEWQALSEKSRERVKVAEDRYYRLAKECEELKQITVQTHVLVDQEGNELQMTETREKVCEMADSAQSQLEQERADLNDLMNEAKDKAVPPGWLRDQEGNDPNE